MERAGEDGAQLVLLRPPNQQQQLPLALEMPPCTPRRSKLCDGPQVQVKAEVWHLWLQASMDAAGIVERHEHGDEHVHREARRLVEVVPGDRGANGRRSARQRVPGCWRLSRRGICRRGLAQSRFAKGVEGSLCAHVELVSERRECAGYLLEVQEARAIAVTVCEDVKRLLQHGMHLHKLLRGELAAAVGINHIDEAIDELTRVREPTRFPQKSLQL